MATGPTIPDDPIELLTPDLSRSEPFINKFWGGALFGTVTFSSICAGNAINKVPVLSGIHRNILWTAAAAVFGQWLDQYRKQYYAEKDAGLRHYISLHPEDFPVREKKKFGDILEPWIPIR